MLSYHNMLMTLNSGQAEISLLSRENTFDADGWMSQAKQLHADIEHSRFTAREIVAQHENTKPLKAKVEDATAKVELVETEIAFNNTVTIALEESQRLNHRLEAGRVALRDGHITAAIETLEEVDETLKKDSLFTNTNIISILSENCMRLRQDIVEFLRMHWSEQVTIDKKNGEIQIKKVVGKALIIVYG